MNKNIVITPEVVRERLEAAFYTLDIPAEIERHTSTRLHSITRGKQYGGACPFPDCSVDTDGFMVWPVLTPRGKHYYCRGCKRSGDILKLVRDIKGLGFSDACQALGIPNPYFDNESGPIHSKPLAKRRTPEASKRQLDELAYLNSLYSRGGLALQRDRARAYLAERAVPFELAESTGTEVVIPALSEVAHVTPEIERFSRWCDRIIFPIRTPDGSLGYCGRSLFLWEPGMDEDEHKAKLGAYNLQMKEQHGDEAVWYQISRWKYTYQKGFFNWQAVKEFDTLVFVEGAFDVLACMVIGLPNAIPIGTTLDAGLLPINVCNAIMGLDVDGPGSKASKDLSKGLRRKGISVQACTPIDAKDWSAAYRIHGMQGLKPLTEAVGSICLCATCLDLGLDTPAPYEVDGLMFSGQHRALTRATF